jgi:hypothetical protein
MPSPTTLSSDVKDTLRKRFNIGYSEFNSPRPDYYINAVLNKIKVTSQKGSINEVRNIFVYGAAGVVGSLEPKKILCRQSSNGSQTANIIKDQTYVEREKKYDTVQICLNNLAKGLVDKIPDRIKISYYSIFKFLGNLVKFKAEKNFDRRHTARIPRIIIFFQRRSWAN